MLPITNASDPDGETGVGLELVDHVGHSDSDHASIHDRQEAPPADYQHQDPYVVKSAQARLRLGRGIWFEAQISPVAAFFRTHFPLGIGAAVQDPKEFKTPVSES